MAELDDHQLLVEFARNGSEAAFASLVSRYVNLVHSTARRSTGNPHHAEEITQAVFIILARKAGNLSARVVLSGWLYQAARLTSANFVKTEGRRRRREQEAYMRSTLDESAEAIWKEIAPLLDDAMGGLGQTDRDAVVLRFFENKSAAEIGAVLRMNEETARRRVNRALEKLRKFFAKRGVTSAADAIAENISANSVQAAPAALAKTATALAITKGSIVPASTLTLVKGTLKIMTWLKLKFALVAGTGAIALVTISAVTIAQQSKMPGPGTNAIDNLAATNSLLILPDVSVGKVKAGMTEDDVIAALGQPERKQGEVLIYDKRFGFSVVCSRNKLVGAVFCGGGVDFRGRTKAGIGIGSSREQLIKAYGQPTSAKPWSADQERLEYRPLGLTFTLRKGKVFHIIVDLRRPQ